MTDNAESDAGYVTTAKGNKAHRRDPGNQWTTLCHKAVYGSVDNEQITRNPHLICRICMQHNSDG